MMTKRYYSTKNLAKIYDVHPKFFQLRKGKELKKNVHFIQPGRNNTLRWDLYEVDKWWRGVDKKANDDAEQELETMADDLLQS